MLSEREKMGNIEKRLEEEKFTCNVKLSWLDIEQIEKCFDLSYQASCIYAKNKSENIIRLKEKILKNTTTKIVN